MAKEISKTEAYEDFLNDLLHKYFDENQLHIFILSEMKDFDECLMEITGQLDADGTFFGRGF